MSIGLKTLVSQVGISISRGRRHNKTQSNLTDYQEELKTESPQSPTQDFDMQNVLPEIQSLARIREVLDKIVKGVVDGLGYTGAMLAIVDNKNQILTIQALAFNRNIRRQNLLDTIEGLSEIQFMGGTASLVHNQDNLGVRTCLTGKTMITHNLYELLQPIINRDLSILVQESIGIKTCISIPLLLEGQVIGNLWAGTGKKTILSDDLDALHFFVTNAAIAVQNSILFERVKRKLVLREAELDQLREIEKMIHSSLDLHEVLKRILDGAIKLTRAEYGHVVLVDNYASGLTQRVTYPEGRKVLDGGTLGLTQLVIRDKRPKLVDNAQLAELHNGTLIYLTDEEFHLYSYSKMRSQLAVPVLLESELIGVIHIASHRGDGFNKHALDMLEQLAVQAAIAIRNAYQFKIEREMRDRFSNLAQVVAMGDMAGNMVHSINNWVGSIRVDINYLKRQQTLGKSNPDELAELLDDMLENTEMTLSMAENIRKPFQALTQEPIDVNECITNVLQKKKEEYSNLMFVIELDDLPLVMATQQLELVFENLLNNALQAMADKDFGILKFSTCCSNDGAWVEVVVKDSGQGLPEHLDEKNIFNLGVSGRQDGLGYGLWWCDVFLKRWGGSIQLIENSSLGCRFLIKIPTSAL